MTDKERLLFLVITFLGKANLLYAYELSSGTDYGEITVARVSNFHTLGRNTIMWSQGYPINPALGGWYLTDTLFKKMDARIEKDPENAALYPGKVPF